MPDGPENKEELERLRKLFEDVEAGGFDDDAMSELDEKLKHIEQEPDPTPDELEELELKLRDVKNRFLQDRDSRRASEESVETEFDARMNRLQDRVDRVKQERSEKAAEDQRRIAGEASSARGAGLGLTVAYMILGVPMFGAAVGYLIDRKFGTSQWIGLCTFAGAILGVTLAVVTLQRTNK